LTIPRKTLNEIESGPARLAGPITWKARDLRDLADEVKTLPSGSAVSVKHPDEMGQRIAGKPRRLHG